MKVIILFVEYFSKNEISFSFKLAPLIIFSSIFPLSVTVDSNFQCSSFFWISWQL